ncbi:MAG: hypothetical protein ACJ8KU_12110 [Chthoniobacterales bacterium]
MRSHEIFQRISPALAAEIFTFLQTTDRAAYKAAIQGLANQRKLRPVFVERKPPGERYAWMQNALGRPLSDALAAHLIQAWLLRSEKEMLCDFLDALEIAHDEDGTVEELPPAPPKEKIQSAVSQLLSKYPAEHVAVYLHAFRDMDSTVQWPALDQTLAEDARLKL